jgi:chromosome segregation ATPase
MARAPATPEGVPRLFDLVKVKDDRHRLAFYYPLRDTLVAKDIEQAVRIAYQGGKPVWRVVTLNGELIDTSGTMAGGGKAVRKGGMASSLAASVVSARGRGSNGQGCGGPQVRTALQPDTQPQLTFAPSVPV